MGGIIEYAQSKYILSIAQSSEKYSKSWQKFYKINTDGDTIKSLIIEKDTTCMFYELKPVDDNKILCVGSSLNRNKPADIWIACIDTSLNLLWEKSINTVLNRVYTTRSVDYDDSSLIIAASLYVDIYTGCIFMIKIDHNGNILSSGYIYNPARIFDLIRVPLTGLLMLPAIGSGVQTYSDGQFLVIDTTFNLLYVDSIPENVSNCCTIKSLNDSVYFLAGNKSYPFNDESYNIALMKMNFPNIVTNSVTVGRPADTVDFGGVFRSMDFIDPSNIYVAGTSNLSVSGGYYAYQPSWYLISRFDSALNIYWTKYYGGDAYYVLQSVTATSDGGAIVAGTRFDYLNHPENQLDVYVLKLDSTGLYVNVDEEKPIPIHDAIVYPNPGSDYLIVQSGPQVSGAVFRMYNMQGRQVMEERLTSTLLRLNAGSLAAGPHPWQIIFNNNVIENGKCQAINIRYLLHQQR